jgi:N-acetylmuramoyl-L-alanine amidase
MKQIEKECHPAVSGIALRDAWKGNKVKRQNPETFLGKFLHNTFLTLFKIILDPDALLRMTYRKITSIVSPLTPSDYKVIISRGRIITSLGLILFTLPLEAKQITIMLNPAGDAHYAGRTIDGTFERGITLQCCEYLKKILEYELSNTRIVLTRIPGETIEPLQNASFSNRLNADLYISIHFYEKKSGRPDLFLYQFSYNATTDGWQSNSELQFVPYHKAYLLNYPTTKIIIDQIHTLFKEQFRQQFDTHSPQGIPFTPLLGITAPAIGIEMSIAKSDEWQHFIPALKQALVTAVNHLKKK